METTQKRLWKPVRGQKGFFWTSVGRGELIKDTLRQAWFFSVGRGAGDGGGDQWGPLDASFEDETSAIGAATRFERQLERAGWFDLEKNENDGWTWSGLYPCLAKLPRQLIPHYFLAGLDEAQAAEGKSVKGNVLHVGGVDVHRWKSCAVDAGMYLDTEATLIFTPPGEKPVRRNKNAFWLQLGRNGFDALISHLIEIRASLATKGAFHAASQEAFRELPGDFDGPPNLRSRFDRIVKKSANINEMFTRLFKLSPGNLATLFMILGVMERGDRITRMHVMPDDGLSEGVVEVLASYGSATATALQPNAFAVETPIGTIH